MQQNELYDFLKANKGKKFTHKELCDELKQRSCLRHLSKLLQFGFIKRENTNRWNGVYYSIK